MAETVLRIEGMHCGACVRRVSQALASVEGVTVKEVRVGAARIESALEPTSAIDALGKIGFAAQIEG